jgi:pimeloyl-ACP methyl ester carboxylesterase
MEKLLKFNQFGSDNGQRVIYFHGVPGAPEECRIFDEEGKARNLSFICFDRFAIDSSLKGEAYYQFLADEISKTANGKPVDVVGFSIGAFIALQTCRYLGENVRNLHLISAAAPLEAGEFLEAMAGKRVFQLAKTFPVLFLLLSYWQGLLALVFPKALFQLLFASAVGKDKGLAANREFQSSFIPILQFCFIKRISGYARDIRAYVRPWNGSLADITINAHIWQGTKDNWSPPMMASYLKSAIPGCAHLEILAELSHYSCLYETAPKICQQLSKT